jgi:hypothetical protein
VDLPPVSATPRCSGEGAAPGWGIISTPLPLGFPGRVIVAKPDDPTSRRSRKCQPRMAAPALPRWPLHFSFARSVRHGPCGGNEGSRSVSPDRALRRDAVWCSLSEACWIRELRECRYAGLRDA